MDQPIQIGSIPFQVLLAQGAATVLAARSKSPGHDRNLSDNPSRNQNRPQPCSYEDILACEPISLHGTEGLAGLSRWIERMEAVFRVSSCPGDWQVIYATSTLMEFALAWWVSHVTSVGFDVAYTIGWGAFKQLMIMEFYLGQEIPVSEQELWNLTMDGLEVTAYTSRFNELSNLCQMMVNPERRKIERYIWGLAQPIQGLVTAAEPGTFDSAKQLAYRFTKQCTRQSTMNQRTRYSTGNTKRKFHGKSEESNKHDKPNPEPVAVYAAITNSPANPSTNRPTPPKRYVGKAPLCTRCNFHHTGNCLSCDSCNGRGHTSRNCKRAPANATTTPATGGVPTCYECHLPGHFKRDCPKLRN